MGLETAEKTQSTSGVRGATATAALLRDLIDYAGLFPPASLSMAASVVNYAAYSSSEWNWILGRFVVPAARLDEFAEAAEALPTAAAETIWRLSALLGPDVAGDVNRIQSFNSRILRMPLVATVESVEVKVSSAEEVNRLSEIIPREMATYFEVPLENCAELIAAIGKSGRRAKIRTGGETADKFPTPEEVIEFIRVCVGARVPFKATAGLHHPLRSVHRLTYQPDSPSVMMHGFLNVFLASAFLRAGMDPKLAVLLLEEQSQDAFHLDSDGISWREHRLRREEIAEARRDFAISFGSCSFTEPIEDLRSLHLL
ncbi:MAG TPA: hypothetical protein VKR59_14235 [Terriglobales bacterium]|nr:hypothetical protein [Terriglobales bacterium]